MVKARQSSWRMTLLTIAMCLGACATFNCLAGAAATITEDRATEMISQLREVRDFDNWLRRQTQGEVHVIIISEDSPDKDSPYWQFYVGEDHDDHTAVWNRFRVQSKDGRILVQADIVDDTWIPLSQWRKEHATTQPANP
jgi:hypothetical protein